MKDWDGADSGLDVEATAADNALKGAITDGGKRGADGPSPRSAAATSAARPDADPCSLSPPDASIFSSFAPS